MNKGYNEYYLKAINAHSTGLKLVLGGTGLGKTHGIRQAIKEHLEQNGEDKRKFIYITNRHNLITEFGQKLNSSGINTSYLKRNSEIIGELVESKQITNVIEHLASKGYFQFDEELKDKYARERRLNKLIEDIESKRDLLKAEKDARSDIAETLKKEINFDCDELYKCLKNQMALIGSKDESLHGELLSDPYVWMLFPYVEFQNSEDCHVLLVTIHKVLKGFFDGRKDIKLASIEEKIIILDEFDFLEQEILKILCDEPSIVNPLEFVTIFYHKFRHWSKSGFWESSAYMKGVKEKFKEVIDYIDDQSGKIGISITDTIDFKVQENIASDKSYLLFQTNRIVTPKPFFLREDGNSFYIQKLKSADSVSPFKLFNVLAIATNKILGIFNYYQKDQSLVEELIQHIWNQKNDNTAGRYHNYIKENSLYHRSSRAGRKENKPYKDKSAYEIGFRLVKLIKRTNSFDPESAELNQVELFTSPEALIAKLSDNNLVFALSATADIERRLKSFDMKWLKENTNFIEVDEVDREIIKYRKQVKGEARKTEVNFRLAKELDKTQPVTAYIESLYDLAFFSKLNDSDNSATPRKSRVLRILDTIYWILNESSTYSHLIFTSSFDHFKRIMCERDQARNHFNTLGKAFSIKPAGGRSQDTYFELTFGGRTCKIIFLDADSAKKLQSDKKRLEEYYAHFNADKVIVITQYKSASNGVNLPCKNIMGEIESDFEGIHLIDSEYFWFESSTDPAQQKNVEKRAYWYLWKLLNAGEIYNHDFKAALSKSSIPHNNSLYLGVNEKVLNAIALFHQAIGRIERTNEHIPFVDVTLEEGVFREFHQFLTEESYTDIIKDRESITSSLILKVHEKVLEKGSELQVRSGIAKAQSIASAEERSRATIRTILEEIEKVKNGLYDAQTASAIKRTWIEVREAVLKQDYKRRVAFEARDEVMSVERDMAVETRAINGNSELLMDISKLQIHNEKAIKRNLFRWDLNFPYQHINKNRAIANYFVKHGYAAQYLKPEQPVKHIFTPYIYQAILQGAIGEKAIEALLNSFQVCLEDPLLLPNELFEVIDGQLKGLPIYVDFKNFGNTTIQKFSLRSEDPGYEEKFDSEVFLNKLRSKLELIRQYGHPEAILCVLNLYSDDESLPDYFDSNLERQAYPENSSIIIIPSVLKPGDASKISSHFEQFHKLIESRYEAASKEIV